jgi:hypothetical protein
VFVHFALLKYVYNVNYKQVALTQRLLTILSTHTTIHNLTYHHCRAKGKHIEPTNMLGNIRPTASIACRPAFWVVAKRPFGRGQLPGQYRTGYHPRFRPCGLRLSGVNPTAEEDSRIQMEFRRSSSLRVDSRICTMMCVFDGTNCDTFMMSELSRL